MRCKKRLKIVVGPRRGRHDIMTLQPKVGHGVYSGGPQTSNIRGKKLILRFTDVLRGKFCEVHARWSCGTRRGKVVVQRVSTANWCSLSSQKASTNRIEHLFVFRPQTKNSEFRAGVPKRWARNRHCNRHRELTSLRPDTCQYRDALRQP